MGLLDALDLAQVFLVGHDWGAWIAWFFCTFRPDRIKALVNLSVPFRPRNPVVNPLQAMRAVLGKKTSMCAGFRSPEWRRKNLRALTW
ncbi:alpha/beta fold hydrolase [Salmonella sp. s58078]|uniref:alpha/beta fold hydrolase n=1 Tax=Salmonella sp. s58078 TaxID=3159699 RepID=UPI00397EA5CF